MSAGKLYVSRDPVEEPREECKDCKGTGSVACPDCDGEGSQECHCDLGGTHEHECTNCDGDCDVYCTACLGLGCLAKARESVLAAAGKQLPPDIMRALFAALPSIDAAGLPSATARIGNTLATVMVSVELRGSHEGAVEALRASGFIRSTERRSTRKGFVTMAWQFPWWTIVTQPKRGARDGVAVEESRAA